MPTKRYKIGTAIAGTPKILMLRRASCRVKSKRINKKVAKETTRHNRRKVAEVGGGGIERKLVKNQNNPPYKKAIISMREISMP